MEYELKPVRARVYLSTRFQTGGTTRPNHVQRMRNAIQDAEALGVPRSYFERGVIPFVEGTSQKFANE